MENERKSELLPTVRCLQFVGAVLGFVHSVAILKEVDDFLGVHARIWRCT